MTDKPIIFSAPMVRALLDGRKTQTRRVLKPQPVDGTQFVTVASNGSGWAAFDAFGIGFAVRAPYAPGDRLWVKETWAHDDPCDVQYRAGPHIADDALGVRWRSPRYMPRWASRLTLTVTDVRVQRLQEITPAAAIAEGCRVHANSATIDCDTPNPRDEFRSLWNSIHGPDAWDRNDWVAAVTFTVERTDQHD